MKYKKQQKQIRKIVSEERNKEGAVLRNQQQSIRQTHYIPTKKTEDRISDPILLQVQEFDYGYR